VTHDTKHFVHLGDLVTLPAYWSNDVSKRPAPGCTSFPSAEGCTPSRSSEAVTELPTSTVLTGPHIQTHFGVSVGDAGDVNGDRFADLVVRQPSRAYVYLGSASGLTATPASDVVEPDAVGKMFSDVP
jgi:hypothetical protein